MNTERVRQAKQCLRALRVNASGNWRHYDRAMLQVGMVAVMALSVDANAQPLRSSPIGHQAHVMSCKLADGRTATVTRMGDQFIYRFGRTATPEIELRGDAASHTVFKLVASFPRAGWTQVRFTNGPTSYILFRYYNLGNFVRNYEGATEQSGLVVVRGDHRSVGRLCHAGEGLEDDAELKTLPDDPEDHADAIIDDVEHHR